MQDFSDNVKVVGVTIRWANHCFHVFVKHHYGCNSFFGRTYANSIYSIFPVYWIKCLWGIYKYYRFLEIFLHRLFEGSSESVMLWINFSKSCFNFSLKFSRLHKNTMCCLGWILAEKLQLYSHLPPISQTIQIRWHAGIAWEASDVLLSTPTHRWACDG